MARQQKLRDIEALLQWSSSSSSGTEESDSTGSSSSEDSFDDTTYLAALLTQEMREDEGKVLEAASLFDLDRHSDSWLIENTRFDRVSLELLHAKLRIPAEYMLDNGSRVPGMEAVVISLCRYAYPNRLCDHISICKRSGSMISRIIKHVTNDLYNRFNVMLHILHHPSFDLEYLAGRVSDKCPLENCIGFIDGTIRGICRPKYDQEEVYNGHKRKHALKYQGVMLSNGIMVMDGPFSGRRHDAGILAETDIFDQLRQLPARRHNARFCLYGDHAYPLGEFLMVPFPNHNITEQQAAFNTEMSEVREGVEYGFGKVVQYYSWVDFSKNQKLYLQPVAMHYLVAVLLTN